MEKSPSTVCQNWFEWKSPFLFKPVLTDCGWSFSNFDCCVFLNCFGLSKELSNFFLTQGTLNWQQKMWTWWTLVQFQCSRTVIIFQQTSIFNYSKWFLFKTIKHVYKDLFTLTKIRDEWGTMQTAWCFGLRSTKLLVYGSNRIVWALDQLSQTLIC